MQQTTDDLEKTVAEALERFGAIAPEAWRRKPRPERWSKQEILGHLIDSAMNNLRRFVVAQYEEQPKIVYRQNHWVAAQRYQETPVEDLIQTWQLLNRQIARTLAALPPELAERRCDIGPEAPEVHPLAWIATDYVRHLRHHLGQIFAN